MKRLFSLLLVLGAMIGLFGQEAAFAAGPAWQAQVEMAAAMPDSCMEQMGEQSDKGPCKGLTLDCIATMGCVVPLLAADALGAQPASDMPAPLLISSTPRRLVGQSTPPGTHPPTPLT